MTDRFNFLSQNKSPSQGRKGFLLPDEQLLYFEENVSAGTGGFLGFKVNDVFDLALVENETGELRLIVYMKLEFFFEGEGDLKWSEAERRYFIRIFQRETNEVWGNNRPLLKLANGRTVYLDYRFKSAQGEWLDDEHWSVYVLKTQRPFVKSYVCWVHGVVRLDSQDLFYTPRQFGSQKQRAIIHEFGHMLGLVDEGPPQAGHVATTSSVMRGGERVYDRHQRAYTVWVKRAMMKISK